ncbi:hypothetical protein L2E82_07866 [Cichorium intybus]|uniref:Uncharacterized protein n=1 Tax=Cichorium intybus TaxID=13427 RepID=A0ACB9G653_CICIN|nr:hypothetical protein L2E82_07866 [Cichorium intybus]
MVYLRARHHVGCLWGLLRSSDLELEHELRFENNFHKIVVVDNEFRIVSGVDESVVMDNEVGGAVQIDGKENFVTDNGTSLEVFDKRVLDKKVDVVVDGQIEVFNCI